LTALDGAGPLAANYLRAAVETIAEREIAAGRTLPSAELETFLLDRSHNPRGRRLAFEWLAAVDRSAVGRLIPKMLDDPSVELRRDAVAQVIEAAEKSLAGGDQQAAESALLKALDAARDDDQIKVCTERLRKLGREVDLPRHFGFLARWHVIGPFDNSGSKAFDVAYPPEKDVDLKATYQGKEGEVAWKPYETTDEYGIVDLTKALDKHKGAIAYASTEFYCEKPQTVDLRLGCINANKIWVNGQLLAGQNVYHAGMFLDQYTCRARLKEGRNVLLLKICQNEQTEAWAQRWEFQLRVCDKVGTAVHSVRK
jgi:hypothetical protein